VVCKFTWFITDLRSLSGLVIGDFLTSEGRVAKDDLLLDQSIRDGSIEPENNDPNGVNDCFKAVCAGLRSLARKNWMSIQNASFFVIVRRGCMFSKSRSIYYHLV
jgi:hypothetical protein